MVERCMKMINNRVAINEKSVVLIGFMGVGKTSIGQLVAQKLGRKFIDIDEEIENEYQMPVTDIFKKIGEENFREKEKNMIKSYAKQKGKVLSLGGGAFMQEEIRDACLANCTVIHLDISWKYWKERLSLLVDSRPVLQGKTIEEIETLFLERQNFYKGHSKIVTDGLTEEEIAEQIIRGLESKENCGSIF